MLRQVAARFVLVLAAGMLTIAPEASRAGEVAVSGQQAIQAGFLIHDASGCVTTSVFMFGGTTTSQTPQGGSHVFTNIFLNASTFDACTSTSMFLGGSSSDVTIAVNGNATQARLTGPIDLCDSSGSCRRFEIEITFTADGEVNRTIQSTHFFCGQGCTNFTKGENVRRLATAQGTIGDGTVNLIPAQSTFAVLDVFTLRRVLPE
jgi:hypothetical protein